MTYRPQDQFDTMAPVYPVGRKLLGCAMMLACMVACARWLTCLRDTPQEHRRLKPAPEYFADEYEFDGWLLEGAKPDDEQLAHYSWENLGAVGKHLPMRLRSRSDASVRVLKRIDLLDPTNADQVAIHRYHRNIARIFDVVEDPDTNAAYVVMELVGGQELTTDCLSTAEARTMVRDVLQGLKHCHELRVHDCPKCKGAGQYKSLLRTRLCRICEETGKVGIVHSDVKLGNIIRDGNSYKVIDFGESQFVGVRDEALRIRYNAAYDLSCGPQNFRKLIADACPKFSKDDDLKYFYDKCNEAMSVEELLSR